MRYVLAAAVLLLCSPAGAAQPYEGAWAGSQGSCSTPDETNLRIAGNRYYEHEGSCTIDNSKGHKGTWALFLTCEGEGEKWKQVVTLEPNGDKLRIGGDRGRLLQRCRKTARPPNWPR